MIAQELPTKYAKIALIPDEALRGKYDKDVLWHTWDDKYVKLEFLGSYYKNSESSLEEICRNLYGLRFSEVRSIWMARLEVKGEWHKVKMFEEFTRERIE